jgi:hypothetical protein
MNREDYTRVKSITKRFENFIAAVKEKDLFVNLISELEEEVEFLHATFPSLDQGIDGKLSRELSYAIVDFYGENSKWIRFVGGVDAGETIEATLVVVRPGIFIGREGSLYNQLNEVLNKKFNKRVHIRLKEEMWNYQTFDLRNY